MYYNKLFNNKFGGWTRNTLDNKTILDTLSLTDALSSWNKVVNGEGKQFRLRYDMSLRTSEEDMSLRTSEESEIIYKPSGGWVVCDFDIVEPFNSTAFNSIEERQKYILQLYYTLLYIKKFLYLNCIEENTYKIFYTGKKGFHLYLREEYFDISPSNNYPDTLKKRMKILFSRIRIQEPKIEGTSICKIDESIYCQGKIRNPSKVNEHDRLFYTECDIYPDLSIDYVNALLYRAEMYTGNTLIKYDIPSATLNFNKKELYPDCIVNLFFADINKVGYNYADLNSHGCRHESALKLRNKLHGLNYDNDFITRILTSMYKYHNIYIPNRFSELYNIIHETGFYPTPCYTNKDYCTENCYTIPVVLNKKVDEEDIAVKNSNISMLKQQLLSGELPHVLTILSKDNYKLYDVVPDEVIKLNVQGKYIHLNFDTLTLNGFGLSSLLSEEERIRVNKMQNQFYLFPVYGYTLEKKKHPLGSILCPYPTLVPENVRELCALFEKQTGIFIYRKITNDVFVITPNGIHEHIEKYINDIKYMMIKYGFMNDLDSHRDSSFQPLSSTVVENAIKNALPITNPLLNYVLSIWDGIDHVSNYIRTITLDPQFHSVDTYKDLYKVLVKFFLLALHGQLCEDGLLNCVPPVIIFSGDQGIGKSRFVHSLIGDRGDKNNPLKPLLYENYTYRPKDSASKFTAAEHMILDCSEYDKLNLQNADGGELKGFLLSSEIVDRRLYSKNVSKMYRRAIIFGSTNLINFIDNDLGDRRIITFKVKKFNLDYFNKCNIKQFWIQIYQLYLKLNKDYKKFSIDITSEQNLFEDNVKFYKFPSKLLHGLHNTVKGAVGRGKFFPLEIIAELASKQSAYSINNLTQIIPQMDAYMQKVLMLTPCRAVVNNLVGYYLVQCGFEINEMIDESLVIKRESIVEDEHEFIIDETVRDDPVPQIVQWLFPK